MDAWEFLIIHYSTVAIVSGACMMTHQIESKVQRESSYLLDAQALVI